MNNLHRIQTLRTDNQRFLDDLVLLENDGNLTRSERSELVDRIKNRLARINSATVGLDSIWHHNNVEIENFLKVNKFKTIVPPVTTIPGMLFLMLTVVLIGSFFSEYGFHWKTILSSITSMSLIINSLVDYSYNKKIMNVLERVIRNNNKNLRLIKERL